MTLIVTLKCMDGVVVASDGQATGFSSGGPIRQKCKKIFELPGKVLMAASGTIGVIQRCREEIAKISRNISDYGLSGVVEERRGEKVEYITLRDKIKRLIFLINKDEKERHKAFYGEEKGATLADVIIVFYDKDRRRFRAWHVAPDGGDEFLDELGYGCSGIGDTFGYAFLKNFYSEDLTVKIGAVVAYRVIKEAIEIGAYGLGEPIDVWVMEKGEEENEEKIEVRQLSLEELNGLSDTCSMWVEAEKEVFRKKIRNESS